MRKYYQINEETARLAKMQNSFSEYKPGEATEIYKGYCDKAYDLLDQIREQRPREVERAEGKRRILKWQKKGKRKRKEVA